MLDSTADDATRRLLKRDSQGFRPMPIPDARHYANFADLQKAQVRGRDYDIHVQYRPTSPVAVIAPHGGNIEDGTSDIARIIADQDCHLYLFEGRRFWHNYRALHLTSHRFDEPDCLALIQQCRHVVAVHGCAGDQPEVLLGGLDHDLKHQIAESLQAADIPTSTGGHRFPAIHPLNIANRGATGRGVQLEITHPLRRDPVHLERVARAVRQALKPLLATADAHHPDERNIA